MKLSNLTFDITNMKKGEFSLQTEEQASQIHEKTMCIQCC
jgi:hypothetical protein